MIGHFVRPRSLRHGLAHAWLVGAVGCGSAGIEIDYDAARPLDSVSPVVTFVDYFEGGRREFDAYLDRLPEAERAAVAEALERASRACVRIEIITARSGMSSSRVSGSGVVLMSDSGAPMIGTAGHSLEGVTEYEAEVTLRDGRRLATSPSASSYETFGSSSDDWAILALEKTPSGLEPLPARSPEIDDLVFVLGYPNGMGVNDRGNVAYAIAFGGEPLAPIVCAATVTATDPFTLRPVAGALPMGGSSGGAILDRNGRVVGLQTGTGWSADRDGTEYWLAGVSVESFAAMLGLPSR